ncbi:phosphatase PAP2 family protein [Streptomyces sp. NPDC004065]|uniref:phosphatase PAP2 family protein n=1 Tax=Streptomyces sp. NPDC004065 TaxID=3364689 RepID=UPI00385071F2
MPTSREQDLQRVPAEPDAASAAGAGRTGSRLVPPLLVSLTAGLPALLFALITWQVVAGGPLLGADRDASRALLHPDRASELLADLGNAQVALPVMVAVLGYAALRGRATGVDRWWLPPLVAAGAMAVLPAFVVPLKVWTARHGTAVMPPGTGYYPSGHTATAAVAYGSAALVLLPLLLTALARRLVAAGCLALVLGVSFGLVRRGYHWPLDVVASWCLCTVLLTPLLLLRHHPRHGRRRGYWRGFRRGARPQ